ncbi:MBL fold metallo-hydrolase [Antarcticibacterium flavum]|uniref:MBL fold metallo-hydrolase n=1 Tax=Antarcticibacterium flavum TaxID=2058175 RepID=A0A5B7X8V7_9FLAO|nr:MULTISPECIES: MBL fold metallo-hydrolase [Antarcticibacterium]MCM4160684.1 MBL fold metallo-hydrolase [Antarcticibacterium sp. W02-3]QCY71168.1 MBL fold metallo-hydrolase [Antarcticibacterium flavum]
MFKRFGKAPAGNRQERIKLQENYRDGKFHNLEPTAVSPKDVSFFKVLKEFITRPNSVTPAREVPIKKTDLFKLPKDKISVVWFGHSSYLINYKGFVILIDPVFSGNASPVKFFGKPFKGTNIYMADDFPQIDLLLITHDHYDHLDYPFIKQIKDKVKKVVCSLGVGAHLELWGIPHEKIIELGWQEELKVNNELNITALPSRHFSGRSTKRFNTLWSSFALIWNDCRIYVGGDSGYSPQFREIGEQFGNFDLAFLECGQYSQYWPQIHMMPEETVKAARDLNAKILFPVHWGKFVLSIHPWNEPINRMVAEANKKDQDFVAPHIGEMYILGEKYDQKEWWNFEDNG